MSTTATRTRDEILTDQVRESPVDRQLERTRRLVLAGLLLALLLVVGCAVLGCAAAP